MERRQQLGSATAERVTACRSMSVGLTIAPAAHPTRRRRPQDGIDGCALDGRRERPDDVQIHRGRV